ncbi:hypothetical protein LA080_004718 [Diaporthe eres]|nr:hypothetical protein LA080_004718 [Diaporthe eres]
MFAHDLQLVKVHSIVTELAPFALSITLYLSCLVSKYRILEPRKSPIALGVINLWSLGPSMTKTRVPSGGGGRRFPSLTGTRLQCHIRLPRTLKRPRNARSPKSWALASSGNPTNAALCGLIIDGFIILASMTCPTGLISAMALTRSTTVI